MEPPPNDNRFVYINTIIFNNLRSPLITMYCIQILFCKHIFYVTRTRRDIKSYMLFLKRKCLKVVLFNLASETLIIKLFYQIIIIDFFYSTCILSSLMLRRCKVNNFCSKTTVTLRTKAL